MNYERLRKYFTECNKLDVGMEECNRVVHFNSSVMDKEDLSTDIAVGVFCSPAGGVEKLRVSIKKAPWKLCSLLKFSEQELVGKDLYQLNPEDVLMNALRFFMIEEDEVKEVDALRYVLHNLIW